MLYRVTERARNQSRAFHAQNLGPANPLRNAYIRAMPSREQKSRLRALCAEKGFALDPLPGGRVFRLVWLEIGHAVRNAGRGTIAFNTDEAIRYLRRFDPDSTI